ncbi:hypothetical protein V4S31_11505 [Enterococcus cecorum]
MEKPGKIEFRKEQKQINYWKWATLALMAIILVLLFCCWCPLESRPGKNPNSPQYRS